MRYFLFFITLSFSYSIVAQNEIGTNTITFYAKDSVIITADTYFLEDIKPTVLLCHQAGYSRGEYLKTAKKLNALGFSCMAIDQRFPVCVEVQMLGGITEGVSRSTGNLCTPGSNVIMNGELVTDHLLILLQRPIMVNNGSI